MVVVFRVGGEVVEVDGGGWSAGAGEGEWVPLNVFFRGHRKQQGPACMDHRPENVPGACLLWKPCRRKEKSYTIIVVAHLVLTILIFAAVLILFPGLTLLKHTNIMFNTQNLY